MIGSLDDSGLGQGFETAIQLELWSRFQTGNVLVDSVIRSLLLGLLVGLITSVMGVIKDDVLYPVCNSLKTLVAFGTRKTRKYSVTLDGYSRTNVHLNERYIFSLEFKAVLDRLLGEECRNSCDDVRSLSQFHNNMDVKYERWQERETREYSYSYILNQSTEVKVCDDIYAKVTISKNESPGGEKSSKILESKTYQIVISSDVVKCNELVEWINKTTSDYEATRKALFDSNRYLARFRGCDKEDGRILWDLDTLTGEATFDSLFFEGKEHFVEAIERFLAEKEFYESVGKPWQLGINLSGPPGCGKTSFIRVLAAVLKRSVKDISFSKIKTNKDFEDAIRCVEYEGKSLSHEKTIIVAEDIDCANMDVIRTRSNSSSSGDSRQEEADDDDGASGDPKKGTTSADAGVAALVSVMKEANRIERSMCVKVENELKSDADSLDLSTILNIMDGVKSSSGRIIVFTTNHPEKIDPALLRPGRIDLDVRFGELSADLVYDMCYHWYSKYSEFYGDVGILERFVNGWMDKCKGRIRDRVIRPCVVHNILQKNGKDVEAALVDLRFACG